MKISKLKIFVLIFICGLGYVGYEFYDFYSNDVPAMAAKQAETERELASRQTELRRLQEFAQNIEVIKQELRELNLQLESALEHMPRNFNLSGLLRRLTMLAQNSGLELNTFKPADKEERAEGSFYNIISIDFDLRGSYTQTLVFFDQISRLKRIMNIDSVNMAVADGAPPRAGSVVLNTHVIIRTYRFSE